MTDSQPQPNNAEQVPPPGNVPPQPPQPPQTPPPGYQAPPPGYQAPPPGYQAPPPGYQAPPPGYEQQPGGYQQQAAQPLSQAEDKQWASFAHFGGILGPLPALIIFLVFKDRGPFTRQEAKEALNWQITFVGAMIILGILSGIITGIVFSGLNFGAYALVSGIFGFLYFALWALNAILSIMGGMKVNGGQAYRYPFAIRLIK